MSKHWSQIQAVKDFISIVSRLSPNAFINCRFELIVEPKNNVYIGLENITSELDLKRKILSSLSRPSCKGVSTRIQKLIRGIVNESLGTHFTEDDMHLIYTYLGNGCNGSLCEQFVESGYDMSILAGRA